MGRMGRCGHCRTEGWAEGGLPPCDDSYCTFPYWEAKPEERPTGYRSIIALAHKCRSAVLRGGLDEAKRISDLISQLEEHFPAAKKALDEDFPGAK